MGKTGNVYDAVVVGGGAAGLSGAVALARSRRSVLVVDAGQQRNAPAAAMHNYLGREGLNPLELVRLGGGELAGYGGEVVRAAVTGVERLTGPAGFRVTLDNGTTVRARRLLVATGLRDELPAVEGLADRWGNDVIHCPYCHGYEHRDRAIGVLASNPMVMHQALMFRQLSPDVVVFTHTAPALAAGDRERLDALGVRVVEGEVAAVQAGPAGLGGVRLVTGEVVPRQVLVVAPRFAARLEGLEGLGLEVTSPEVDGFVLGTSVVADPSGKTPVPGVWAAGNVTSTAAQVVVAAGQGLTAGAQINFDLILEDAALAVRAGAR
ncbi:NAD(P)/FAD-dependent oxidoreductase [Kineosporia sp. J2-2]|uniref:NAD(P)/FAD-dependent oxidoreductase n=1 Tax=Kineosporia corallincola TaxID=2835133 RepID=A0ABS5TMT4_9ACTN|nr:NAD(P)/FAD-dependent oxidoreductase [Kineosporia corallincola]MBT0772395.1 NAD(P)/FAD-dependent oxidoreductase [Kineosporia corallincola]